MGRGREEEGMVGVDGGDDFVMPRAGAEGFDVFVPGEVDGLEKSLGEIG